MADFALEQWNLDSIIPGRLQPIEKWHMLVDDMGGPEQEIETQLHGNALRLGLRRPSHANERLR